MLAFLYSDDWDENPDDDFRMAWHTALICMLTTLLLGLWLLNSMAHPPRPLPPAQVETTP